MQHFIDLEKGYGNRDGLIQQVITYVRDGRVVTRKQWVKSDYADHAKKNQEQKKRTLLKQAEKELEKEKKDLEEAYDKRIIEDRQAREKIQRGKEEQERKTLGDELFEYRKQLREKMEDADKQRQEDIEQANNKKRKDEKEQKNKKDDKSRYGQQEQSKDSNKQEENIATQYLDRKSSSKMDI